MTDLKHLGIIADGNRRWAKAQGLPTIEGHKKGLSVIKELVNTAGILKISYLTFYVFSNENWSRSETEVSYIMKLAEAKILKYAEEIAAKNGKLNILGAKSRLSPKLLSLIEKAEQITKDSTGIIINFCFNYGGEQEIADAANIALESEKSITPENIRKHLYHPEVPDLDMIVRTSGEQRFSGFMLYRAAYAEFMFIDKYFPDLTGDDIEKILKEYEKRNRRFGK